MTASAATSPAARGDDRAPRLLRAGAALGAATVVASAANFAGNVALGRHLDAREFADAALVVSGLLLLSSLALGLQLWVAGIAIWLIGHAAAVYAAKTDPYFAQVLARHVKHKPLMEA